MSGPCSRGVLSAAKRASGWPVVLKACVSLTMLAGLLWWLPTETLVSAILTVAPLVWLGIFTGFIGGHIISALKWRLMLHSVAAPAGKIEVIKAHGAGLFANLCLPSVIGGDFVRAAMIARAGRKIEVVALGSLVDRLNDTLALVVIAGCAGLWLPISDSLASEVLSLVALLLLVGVVIVVLCIWYMPQGGIPLKLQPTMGRLRKGLEALFARPLIGVCCFWLSLLVQLSFIGLNVVLADAVGITAPIYLWFFAWPLAKLVALVPVSLGGIGVREAALVSIMTPFGLDSALVVAQGLSWQVVLVGTGLLAGLLVSLAGGLKGPGLLEN